MAGWILGTDLDVGRVIRVYEKYNEMHKVEKQSKEMKIETPLLQVATV